MLLAVLLVGVMVVSIVRVFYTTPPRRWAERDRERDR
jgi:hypothetical protein